MEEKLKIEKKKSMKKNFVLICLVIIIISGFLGIIFQSVSAAFTGSEPYKYTMELIRNNRELKAYLGEDFNRTGMISGSIRINGNASGNAVMSFKLKGKNGISRVYVDAYKENGIWNYTKIIVYKKIGEKEAVNLLEE